MWVAYHVEQTGLGVLILTAGVRTVAGKRVIYQQQSGDENFQALGVSGQPERVARGYTEMFQWIDE